MNPISIATKGKGPFKMLKRVRTIGGRYGVTPDKMDRILARFAGVLDEFGCGATFPITTAALARNKGIVEKYQAQNIEFAVHGYYHVDHTQLSLDAQLEHFTRARHAFEAQHVTCRGFRCPYLRWNDDTIEAVTQAGFLYDSSQGLAWDVVKEVETPAYRHVLGFYGAASAADYPALPRWDKNLVRIPYCLPDDESLIDRFQLKTDESKSRLWLAVLDETYRLGELFTLGLHPERIDLCEAPLRATLRRARDWSPAIWIARLDEITQWWKDRTAATTTLAHDDGREFQINVEGPAGVRLMARGVEWLSPSAARDGMYHIAEGASIRLRAARRPFIGVSPESAPYLTSFLRQQGYIVERTADGRSYGLYLHRPDFQYQDERPLLTEIERSDFPLARLGRWPNGARSALCITGDIDALTIWDYGLRFFGG